MTDSLQSHCTGLEHKLAARERELAESLEQQAAAAEILRVIRSSPTDTQPVFDAVAESAARLCGAHDVVIRLIEGNLHRAVAHCGPIPTNAPQVVERGTMSGRAMLDARTIHVPDVTQASVREEYPQTRTVAMGLRSYLAVPLVREGTAIGVINVRRLELRPFTDKQIKLLETFAAQAVIAIENVRLFKELEARNRDLTESLEQQTATAEILRIISSSPTDTQPVLEAVAESAARLCGAHDVVIRLVEGNVHRTVAHYGPIPITPLRVVTRTTISGRAILDVGTVHIHDITEAHVREEYPENPNSGHRTFLAVPLVREATAIGVIGMRRLEVRPFTDKQIKLLETFAAQAVIAIENVRLFRETKEALEQQTATSEILRSISNSPSDIQPVLDAVAENAARLCHAEDVVISLVEGESTYRKVAHHGSLPSAADVRRFSRKTVVGRALLDRAPVHIHDVAEEWVAREFSESHLGSQNYRTILVVPLVRDDKGLGAINLRRAHVEAFSSDQITLLQTFAAQATIAIENVRLFHAIEQKSRELEVANRHKSEFLAGMSHELRTPLNAILGFSEVLAERMFGDINEKQAEYLEDIRGSGTHLLSLINDILDLSKIEAGRMELELSTFDIAAALENALTLVRERATRHGIGLDLRCDAGVGPWRADERKFKQIMLNLLSNAVKFTPPGGRITVEARRDGDSLEIGVSDTGCGISAADQALVFDEFRQVGGDSGKKAEGTGLGLALTRKFVELHGGSISVRSEAGKGATFSFRLPAPAD